MVLVTEFIFQNPSRMAREIFLWVPTSKSWSPLVRLSSWKLCHQKVVWAAHVWCYASCMSLCYSNCGNGSNKNIASLYKPPLPTPSWPYHWDDVKAVLVRLKDPHLWTPSGTPPRYIVTSKAPLAQQTPAKSHFFPFVPALCPH